MIWWVHRPAGPNTAIAWAGQYEQVGYAEEQLDDKSSSDLQAFLTQAPLISATTFLDRLGADGSALLASPFGFALVRLAAAGIISLNDPQVVAGMQAAVDAGVIDPARAAELLSP